jgi:hypothetical protein
MTEKLVVVYRQQLACLDAAVIFESQGSEAGELITKLAALKSTCSVIKVNHCRPAHRR